jgi:protein-S-isoprenylcysteine O-methyltransferase Ste14
MTDDFFLQRLTTAGLFSAYSLIRLVFRWRNRDLGSHKASHRERSSREGRRAFFTRLVLFPVFVALVVAFASGTLPLLQFDDHAVFLGLGLALSLAGLGLLTWVHLSLGRYWSPDLELREQHRLIVHGPFARIRHPMYSAACLFFVGAGLTSGNWAVLLPGILIVSLLLVRIQREERMLLERFGAEYEAYKRRSGALWPALFSKK